MANIIITEKPEQISYEEIRRVLHAAHQENMAKGIVLKTMTYTAEKMEGRIRENGGKTFVAMDGDVVAGTVSCWPATRKKWYHNGPVMKLMLLGIVPSYRGQHIAPLLFQAVENEARAAGLPVIYLDTAEKNTRMIQLSERMGFERVDFFAPTSNHYSVALVKWLDGCPYSKLYCKLKYTKRKWKTIKEYKPGKIKRFQ